MHWEKRRARRFTQAVFLLSYGRSAVVENGELSLYFTATEAPVR
jgi:hypothetical protein